jgi:23S rRNA (cytidine1920-2'-O)/16S rRNA (cytidine1409-2'-O)-methyltransferase
MPQRRERLDRLLAGRGFFENQDLAARAVMAGKVSHSGKILDKPGALIPADAELSLEAAPKFVGRGGFKLEAALDRFGIDPAGRVCLDIGASTGGFTDCLLQRGASFVHAVDVGRGQLDWRLRGDARVAGHEGVNARFLGSVPFEPAPQMAVGDVSFISLVQILPPVFEKLPPGADLVFLIKPQFEVPKDTPIPGGVVRDAGLRTACVGKVKRCVLELGHTWVADMESPVAGRDGNIEHLAHMRAAG